MEKIYLEELTDDYFFHDIESALFSFFVDLGVFLPKVRYISRRITKRCNDGFIIDAIVNVICRWENIDGSYKELSISCIVIDSHLLQPAYGTDNIERLISIDSDSIDNFLSESLYASTLAEGVRVKFDLYGHQEFTLDDIKEYDHPYAKPPNRNTTLDNVRTWNPERGNF